MDTALVMQLGKSDAACANVTVKDSCVPEKMCDVKKAVSCVHDLKDLLVEDDTESFTDTDVLCR